MPEDPRPDVWIGHVVLGVPDVKATADFMVKLGMRPLDLEERIAILELRGGTHLILLPGELPVEEGASAPFDLMVDDLEPARKRYADLGLGPSEVQSNRNHRFFTLVEPGGHKVTVNSTHVSDQPV